MKKAFKYYLIAWAILFVLFNVVVIALPKEVTIGSITYTKFAGLSWLTLVVFELCFIAHIVLTGVALRQNKLSGTFYRLPLIRISYAGIIVTTILGCLAMAVPNLPSVVPLLLSLLVAALYAIALLKAGAAAELVENIDTKIRTQTTFIRELTADANALLSRAKSEPIKAACKKVCDAVRYADPMSSERLYDLELRMGGTFDKLHEAVKTDDTEAAEALANELLSLISERNQKCKAEKQ